ncbi:hypothetical protein Patl1_04067 [Pistacia atlantica]|uniref:Uncharacterized protein n=1 Tax=Pistacia atlantica TaxID=434234 RepID=A0ACC1BW22_9ROSI|nr:hypothetical protein Patl1_04067 [Pistacia atlantica]
MKKDGDKAVEYASIKPVERKKKRKAMDKERHHATIENKESQPKQTDVALNSEGTQSSTMFSSNSDMPEFHISVFQDLASIDVSLRQAAVESLVTQLEEVQKDYERCGKELVENGIKLEADKDDGLNDCAPSREKVILTVITPVAALTPGIQNKAVATSVTNAMAPIFATLKT